MGRIFCISDTHVCHASPRWAECQRVLTWFADLAVREADLVIHCGDLFDRTASTRDREFAHWWVHRVTSHCPLILIRGNHDPLGEIDMLAAHASNNTCYTAEEPCVIVEAGVVVQCLPWPRVAELAARTGATGADLDERAREALRDVLRGLAVEADRRDGSSSEDHSPMLRVLATHALITGAVTSHGQPLVGGELALGLADLALAEADCVVAGHIHAPQGWTYGTTPIDYCGSPFATAFGEREEKSILRIVAGEHLTGTRVATPAQRMIDVTGRYVQADAREAGFLASAHLDYDTLPDVQGHQVRLRYSVPAEHRAEAASFAAAAKAAWLRDGAERVVVEPEVLVASTARAPEIARATTVREQLEAMWTARSDRPADADGVLSALAEIEEAA